MLLESNPAAHATVSGSSVTVKLRFNVRIDVKRSRVALVLPDSSQKLMIVNQPTPDVLESQATGLANGHYSLRWQVLASDGHITKGEIPFSVSN